MVDQMLILTMIDRMLLLFPCNTLYRHGRWLIGLLDVMDHGADYWCFSNDFPPGCLVFPCNTLYNARMMFVCFSCNTLYNALTMVDHTPGCYASRVSIIGVSQSKFRLLFITFHLFSQKTWRCDSYVFFWSQFKWQGVGSVPQGAISNFSQKTWKCDRYVFSWSQLKWQGVGSVPRRMCSCEDKHRRPCKSRGIFIINFLIICCGSFAGFACVCEKPLSYYFFRVSNCGCSYSFSVT